MFVRDDLNVTASYKKKLKSQLDIRVQSLNFDLDNATEIMNNWVHDRTEGKINQLFPPGFLLSVLALGQ